MKGMPNFTTSLGGYSKGGHVWVENPQGDAVIDVCVASLFPEPKKLHMVERYEGQRFSIIGFTMNHLGKLRTDELQMLQELEFPQPLDPQHHAQHSRQEENEHADDMGSSDDEAVATGYLASLLDYRNSPAEAQLGLDEAMVGEWTKYQEFHAVVPC